jgi:predicted HD phosphohydrolase
VTADEIAALLASLGATPSVEQVAGFTELDHALQCADILARRFPDDTELQVAGLVHDIGHRFGSDEEHGRLGADAVRPALGERVATLVEAHVPAKRYLVATDATYRDRLSPDSVRTLAVQGGALPDEEARAFAGAPYAASAVALRRADEEAKVAGRAVTPLERWLELLHACAAEVRSMR